jgi:hypothetical protein
VGERSDQKKEEEPSHWLPLLLWQEKNDQKPWVCQALLLPGILDNPELHDSARSPMIEDLNLTVPHILPEEATAQSLLSEVEFFQEVNR